MSTDDKKLPACPRCNGPRIEPFCGNCDYQPPWPDYPRAIVEDMLRFSRLPYSVEKVLTDRDRLTAELATAREAGRREVIEQCVRHVVACTEPSTREESMLNAGVLVNYIVEEIRSLLPAAPDAGKDTPNGQ